MLFSAPKDIKHVISSKLYINDTCPFPCELCTPLPHRFMNPLCRTRLNREHCFVFVYDASHFYFQWSDSHFFWVSAVWRGAFLIPLLHSDFLLVSSTSFMVPFLFVWHSWFHLYFIKVWGIDIRLYFTEWLHCSLNIILPTIHFPSWFQKLFVLCATHLKVSESTTHHIYTMAICTCVYIYTLF